MAPRSNDFAMSASSVQKTSGGKTPALKFNIGRQMKNTEFFDALTHFKGGQKEPLYETTAVLSYEVGGMLEQAMYLYWQGQDPARLGFFKSELMDAIAQIILICESVGVSFEDMRELGIEKAMERFMRKEVK